MQETTQCKSWEKTKVKSEEEISVLEARKYQMSRFLVQSLNPNVGNWHKNRSIFHDYLPIKHIIKIHRADSAVHHSFSPRSRKTLSWRTAWSTQQVSDQTSQHNKPLARHMIFIHSFTSHYCHCMEPVTTWYVPLSLGLLLFHMSHSCTAEFLSSTLSVSLPSPTDLFSLLL